jgi:predicted small secreted protein
MKKIKGKMNLMRTGVVLCCLVAIFLSACATGAGLGRDVQSLGRGIEKTAE